MALLLKDIQNTVERLIGRIGSASLLSQLNKIELEIDFKKLPLPNEIKGIILKYYGLSEQDLKKINRTTTSSKRLICWFLRKKTTLKVSQIYEFLSITQSTYNNYINYVDQVLEFKQKDLEFFNQTIEITGILSNK